MGNLGSPELIVLAIIIVAFFGSQKLKDLARGLGESAKEIKKLQEEIDEDNAD